MKAITALIALAIFITAGVTALPAPIQDKTLVAWVCPSNLTQQGGSVLTLIDKAEHFDAIVLGEVARGKWMAGSDFFRRTHQDQASWPQETAGSNTLAQVAITYRGNRVNILRSGKEYADYPLSQAESFGDLTAFRRRRLAALVSSPPAIQPPPPASRPGRLINSNPETPTQGGTDPMTATTSQTESQPVMRIHNLLTGVFQPFFSPPLSASSPSRQPRNWPGRRRSRRPGTIAKLACSSTSGRRRGKTANTTRSARPWRKINPDKLDTDQWVAAAEAMGAKYIVFVAKHTGGFCWWQTDTTDYGVRNIPWRGGRAT